MSGDPRDPNYSPDGNQGPDQRPDERQGRRPEERSGQPGEPRFESRNGFQPAQPGTPRPGQQQAAPRQAVPWDLTTRVPAAGQKHANPEDLTLLAMQLLSPEEAAAITEHVEHCADCRRELASVRGDLGAYAFTVEMRDPADAARERLMRQVGREKKAIPISQSHSRSAPIATFGRTTSILVPDVEETARPSRTAHVLAWTGWAVAAGLAVTSGVIYRDREGLRNTLNGQATQVSRLATEAAQAKRLMDAVTDPHAQRVTLTTKPLPPAPIGRATYNAEKGTLVFLASDMEPLQPAKTYELWLIPADGTASLPAGIFRPDDRGNASVIMPPLPKGIEAKGFGVTIEDEGGSQTPTKPIILVGF